MRAPESGTFVSWTLIVIRNRREGMFGGKVRVQLGRVDFEVKPIMKSRHWMM